MKTDDLIEALSRNLEPATPARAANRRLAATIVVGAAAGLLLLLLIWGVRDSFSAHLGVVLAKAGFSAILAATALPLTVRLARPGAPLGRRLLAPPVALIASLGVAGIAVIGVDPADRWQAWTGGGMPLCLIFIPFLAAPLAGALLWFVRSLAPTRLALAGAAIGGFSGGVAAMIYAMYCPIDSVAFVTTWYALAIALCAALGAIVGNFLLRW